MIMGLRGAISNGLRTCLHWWRQYVTHVLSCPDPTVRFWEIRYYWYVLVSLGAVFKTQFTNSCYNRFQTSNLNRCMLAWFLHLLTCKLLLHGSILNLINYVHIALFSSVCLCWCCFCLYKGFFHAIFISQFWTPWRWYHGLTSW